jgi:predicted AlkP superfamily pyrophosphatase or phosphodiesterase
MSAGGGGPTKLVLTVIDAMKPAMLERAVATGRAPALKALIERGVYVDDCVAAFPSVTPVCAASIATGVGVDAHDIPSMNWYHRGEGRYVEYGTSFKASQTFGFKRSLTDTIYNMNLEHLSSDVETVFESLDDADVRTAGTTYLMYRGRHRHEVTNETALTRLASTVFRHAVYGPREFFYADLFASRKTGCRSQLGLPGVRDQHAGCVGAHLVEHDLFDFLLLSLPDNDTHSHRNGPFAQVASIAAADKQIERLMHAAGGPDEFLADHAMIVLSDHSQSQVESEIDLFKAFDGFELEPPAPVRVRRDGEPPEIAVCPSSRSAQVYVLDRDRRTELVPRIERTALALEGVDLVMHLTDHPDGEASIRGRRGELRFQPGGDLTDLRGARWHVEGDRGLLDLEERDGRLVSATYPDALGRAWSALRCRTSAEVLLSARPGYEFTDWGGDHHVGGGSHGSLHANDSLGALLWCGTGPSSADAREQWSLRDVVPMVREHFGVAGP